MAAAGLPQGNVIVDATCLRAVNVADSLQAHQVKGPVVAAAAVDATLAMLILHACNAKLTSDDKLCELTGRVVQGFKGGIPEFVAALHQLIGRETDAGVYAFTQGGWNANAWEIFSRLNDCLPKAAIGTFFRKEDLASRFRIPYTAMTVPVDVPEALGCLCYKFYYFGKFALTGGPSFKVHDLWGNLRLGSYMQVNTPEITRVDISGAERFRLSLTVYDDKDEHERAANGTLLFYKVDPGETDSRSIMPSCAVDAMRYAASDSTGSKFEPRGPVFVPEINTQYELKEPVISESIAQQLDIALDKLKGLSTGDEEPERGTVYNLDFCMGPTYCTISEGEQHVCLSTPVTKGDTPPEGSLIFQPCVAIMIEKGQITPSWVVWAPGHGTLLDEAPSAS